jgi:hypothetical protein
MICNFTILNIMMRASAVVKRLADLVYADAKTESFPRLAGDRMAKNLRSVPRGTLCRYFIVRTLTERQGGSVVSFPGVRAGKASMQLVFFGTIVVFLSWSIFLIPEKSQEKPRPKVVELDSGGKDYLGAGPT